MHPPHPTSTLLPYTTLFRSQNEGTTANNGQTAQPRDAFHVRTTDKQGLLTTLSRLSQAMRNVEDNPESKAALGEMVDRKSTRLNSSHVAISYAVFCLKKKKKKKTE